MIEEIFTPPLMLPALDAFIILIVTFTLFGIVLTIMWFFANGWRKRINDKKEN